MINNEKQVKDFFLREREAYLRENEINLEQQAFMVMELGLDGVSLESFLEEVY